MTLAVLAVSLWLLFTRQLRHDIVGVISALVLVAAGVVAPGTLLQDLSSTAVIVLVTAMMISGVLSASGVLDVVGDRIALAVRNEYIAVVLVLVMVAVFSGFVSDVAIMLAFMPVISAIASRFKRGQSRYLIALSYAAIAGGRYTMLGTSSNIILESLWINRFGRPLDILAPAKTGLLEALSVAVAVAVLGPLLVRARERKANIEELGPREYLMEVQLTGERSFTDVRELEKKLGVKVIMTKRRTLRSRWRSRASGAETRGTLLVRVPKERITVLLSEKGIKTTISGGPLYELLVSSGSRLVERTIDEVNRESAGLRVVGVWSSKKVTDLSRYALRPGDVILVEGKEEDVASLAEDAGLMPIRGSPLKVLDTTSAAAGLMGISIAVAGSLLGLNVALSFITGAVAAATVSAVTASTSLLRRIYSFVDWPVIVFVGTYMTVGQALLHSGLGSYVAFLTAYPLALFGVSLVLSNLVGNAATASILGPLAVYSPHPLTSVIAVAMGASSTFLTPASHPCNMVAYSVGGYDPKEFVKVGAVAIAVVTALTVFLVMK